MKFVSTRGGAEVDCAAKAIAKGLAEDGGLFVPEFFPHISLEDLSALSDKDYAERACFVLHKFLTEYDKEELLQACKNAYAKFEESDAAPLVKLDAKLFIMELFHGPTLAFKDIALTILPHFTVFSTTIFNLVVNLSIPFWPCTFVSFTPAYILESYSVIVLY